MTWSRLQSTVLLLLLAMAGDAVRAQQWRDDFTSRVEALALLQTLNADLLSQGSATLTLDRWCDAHKLATPPRIVAQRVKDREKAPTPEQRETLRVSATEPVAYRRVRLTCGEHILAEADNWYVPSRLTADMNRTLETSDAAFGRVVQPLHFQRHTVSAKLLWSPLPEGWEMKPAAAVAAGSGSGSGSIPLQVPHDVLQHHAVLTLPDGTPFSEVVETYTSEVLAFPRPPR